MPFETECSRPRQTITVAEFATNTASEKVTTQNTAISPNKIERLTNTYPSFTANQESGDGGFSDTLTSACSTHPSCRITSVGG